MIFAVAPELDQLHKDKKGERLAAAIDYSRSPSPFVPCALTELGLLFSLGKDEQSVCVWGGGVGGVGEGISLAYLTTHFPELFVNTYYSKNGKVKIEGKGEKNTFKKHN